MAGDECKLSIFNYLECDSTNPLAEQEIKGLEALEYEMSRNVQSMRRKRQSAAFSETLQGRIYQLCGKAFAVYCYIRFVGVKQGKLLLAFLLADLSTIAGHYQCISSYFFLVFHKLSRFIVTTGSVRVDKAVRQCGCRKDRIRRSPDQSLISRSCHCHQHSTGIAERYPSKSMSKLDSCLDLCPIM